MQIIIETAVPLVDSQAFSLAIKDLFREGWTFSSFDPNTFMFKLQRSWVVQDANKAAALPEPAPEPAPEPQRDHAPAVVAVEEEPKVVQP